MKRLWRNYPVTRIYVICMLTASVVLQILELVRR